MTARVTHIREAHARSIQAAADRRELLRGPDGVEGRAVQQYVGLRGQPRVALVDACGRVHHHDAADLRTADTHAWVEARHRG